MHIRVLFQITAVVALIFGINPPDPTFNGGPSPIPRDLRSVPLDRELKAPVQQERIAGDMGKHAGVK